MRYCILRKHLRTHLFIFFFFLFISVRGYCQPCTAPGQNPSTAFSVCGSTTFSQNAVPSCKTNNLFVPGCSDGYNNPEYADKNPFWYRFICSTSGTLGFVIRPHGEDQDYDWQLFDITGRNPNDVYTDTSLVVGGNWAGSFGETGASATGFPGINCASEADGFSIMPNLVEGHEYLLLVSCFTDGNNGYTLSFREGTAVINDPSKPHLQTAQSDCSNKITVKLNKKMRCSSLTPSGSEFSLSSAAASIVSATSNACSAGALYVEELTITLSNALPSGRYHLSINYGSDGNTLLDDCDLSIPPGEQLPFQVTTPQPIFADSIGQVGCSPDALRIYFPKKINCSTVAADGSDFVVNGPSSVTIIGAAADCVNGLSQVVTVLLLAPIYTKGDYSLTLKTGTDGTSINDICDLEMPQQTLTFHTEDTVSAKFKYSSQLGCRFNTVTFSHDGAHDVNTWNWRFNNSTAATTQEYTTVFAASSTNEARLVVTNGTCSDTATNMLTMDNEVKANFKIADVICPGEAVNVINTSTGLIDKWQWNFGGINLSDLKDPALQYFPQNSMESYYTVTLKVTNNAVGCSDSISKTLRVLSNCIIAVPSAFSPNSDGLNDFLYPLNAMKASALEFKVFDRWGQVVFSTRNPQEKWNGKVNGIMQQPGVYVWYLNYTDSVTGQKVFQKGTTMLMR